MTPFPYPTSTNPDGDNPRRHSIIDANGFHNLILLTMLNILEWRRFGIPCCGAVLPHLTLFLPRHSPSFFLVATTLLDPTPTRPPPVYFHTELPTLNDLLPPITLFCALLPVRVVRFCDALATETARPPAPGCISATVPTPDMDVVVTGIR